ncbi:hypothetical protein Drorol1_Dr00025199, partial [Drosera rotundifolia]
WCADKRAEYALEVKGVEISPDPVASGRPATSRFTFTDARHCVTMLSLSNDYKGGAPVATNGASMGMRFAIKRVFKRGGAGQ